MLRSCVLAFAGLLLFCGDGRAEPPSGPDASGAAAVGAAGAGSLAAAAVAAAASPTADSPDPDDPALDDLRAPAVNGPAAPTPPAVAAPPPPPEPTLVASINLTEQKMVVSEKGEFRYSWPISSGVARFATPTGTFQPEWTSKMWYSRKYDWAPMPHAVFINGGVAVHATYHVSALGSPASHGCIRLSPANAKTFYNLVQRHGLKNVKVTVYGRPNWRGEGGVASRGSSRKRSVASGEYNAWFWSGSGGRKRVYDGSPAMRKRYANDGYYYTDGTPARTYRSKNGKLVFAPREKRRRASGYGYGNGGYGSNW